MNAILYGFGQKPVIAALFMINLLGTIYGYYWYIPQLVETPPVFLAFVPDSPTASLFFTAVLLFFLFKKNAPLLEALAIVTLFKYGIWAVVMNLLVLLFEGSLPWEGYMLIASHFGMAVQGILYSPYFRFKLRHLMITAVWTVHNDVIDYVFGMMPKYYTLMSYMPQIGYFTFWLSILSIFLGYWFVVRRNSAKLELS
ncbi:DUF1405 domain-containing protein [Metabacillus sp. GX 13764]|uniref:DUF1405 domain-containing protein n=1 Tax=Metabacillus kandeliae TaxID=2900151 RepID=UPI001E473968|nr:DUF1405 domain-containing protein [Metabacillus kandeliae]MCD7033384.1 DUF1405 domain-containing protein [Metabacillus kandeliae]